MSQRMFAYIRVSTDDQAQSGLGLEDQKRRIEAAAGYKGWTVAEWAVDAGVSSKVPPYDRPQLGPLLRRLAAREARGLVVAKLDRLARSTFDFSGLADRAEKEGWSIVMLDPDVDMTTDSGRMIAEVISVFAAYERRQIRSRTMAALASKAVRGERVGGKVEIPDDIRQRIVRERFDEHRTLQAIADGLILDDVPTARGGTWRPSTVKRVLNSVALDRELERARASSTSKENR